MKKLLSAIVIVSFIAFSCGLMPKFVEKNGVKIQYSNGATKEETTKLLDYLDKGGFSDGSKKDLKLEKSGDGYILKMVIKDGFELDDENVEMMVEFGCELSKNVFDGKSVSLELCSNTWDLKKALKSDNCNQLEIPDKKSKMFGNVELLYGETITEKEQKDVGDYLTGYFGEDKERTFVINKKDGRGNLSIVVIDKKYYDDPELLDTYRIIACDLTKILGYATDVYMCNEYLKKQKVVEASKCE